MSSFEKEPWRMTTAYPSPVSCQASRAPSEAVKLSVVGLESDAVSLILSSR